MDSRSTWNWTVSYHNLGSFSPEGDKRYHNDNFSVRLWQALWWATMSANVGSANPVTTIRIPPPASVTLRRFLLNTATEETRWRCCHRTGPVFTLSMLMLSVKTGPVRLIWFQVNRATAPKCIKDALWSLQPHLEVTQPHKNANTPLGWQRIRDGFTGWESSIINAVKWIFSHLMSGYSNSLLCYPYG